MAHPPKRHSILDDTSELIESEPGEMASVCLATSLFLDLLLAEDEGAGVVAACNDAAELSEDVVACAVIDTQTGRILGASGPETARRQRFFEALADTDALLLPKEGESTRIAIDSQNASDCCCV